MKRKIKFVLTDGKKVKPCTTFVEREVGHRVDAEPPKVFEFKDDDINMYCDDENLPSIYKQIEELYLFLREVEVDRREQVLREVCPDESEENIKIVMDCITNYEREYGLKVLSKKEMRALANKEKAEEKAFQREIIIY